MTELATFTEPRPYRWTTEDYLALADVGAFERSGRIELIEGEILERSPQQTIHSFLKVEVARRLANALAEIDSPFRVYGEPTLQVPPDSAPEPDIAISTQPPGRSYLPLAGLALLVEIANTSIEHDLGRKAELYGRSGVPEYWVLEVAAACIHRMWSPSPLGFAERDIVELGSPCASVTMPELKIATTGLI